MYLDCVVITKEFKCRWKRKVSFELLEISPRTQDVQYRIFKPLSKKRVVSIPGLHINCKLRLFWFCIEEIIYKSVILNEIKVETSFFPKEISLY